jgi:hypothetical protein
MRHGGAVDEQARVQPDQKRRRNQQFYADRQCLPKLDRQEKLSPDNEVTSIFDMEANTSAPSTQQQPNGPSAPP